MHADFILAGMIRIVDGRNATGDRLCAKPSIRTPPLGGWGEYFSAFTEANIVVDDNGVFRKDGIAIFA